MSIPTEVRRWECDDCLSAHPREVKSIGRIALPDRDNRDQCTRCGEWKLCPNFAGYGPPPGPRSDPVASIRAARDALWAARAEATEGGHWEQRDDGIMVFVGRDGQPMTYCGADVYEALVAAAQQREPGA